MEERLPPFESTFLTGGVRIRLENPRHLVDIACDHCGVDVAPHHLRITSEEARSVGPSFGCIGVARGLPLSAARVDTVVHTRVLEERVDALLVRCERRGRLALAVTLQRGPALEAVLASQCLLHDAKRDSPLVRDHTRQAVVRFAIAVTNGVQPPLGFSSQRVEGCSGLERTRHEHLPSVVCLCPLTAGRKKVELWCCRCWVEAGSLAADRWRPRGLFLYRCTGWAGCQFSHGGHEFFTGLPRVLARFFTCGNWLVNREPHSQHFI